MKRPAAVLVEPGSLLEALERAGIAAELVDAAGNVLAATAAAAGGPPPLRITCVQPQPVDDELQRQMLEASRLAAVGQLASGIAHEINNPAAYAMLNLSFALELVEAMARAGIGVNELRDLLRETLLGLDKIKVITRDLRLFSRVERDEEGPVDLGELIRGICRMAGHDIRKKARLRLFLGPVPPILGDGGKLALVVSNLLSNALQAIESGTVEDNEIAVGTMLDGDQVLLSVTDTGCGIPAELHDRVFEPFFTTRDRRQGVGLGLAVCAEVVRRHGGTIRLVSTVGGGTRVEVRLPLRMAAVDPVAARAAAASRRERLRVLVVDDDPMVLRAYVRVLSSSFDLVVAEGGAEALDIVGRDQDFDAVLCDLVMPQIDGVTFFERASEVIPDLDQRIVLCSGGAINERTREFIAQRRVCTVDKPVDAPTLRRVLEEAALRAGPPGSSTG